MTLSSVVLRLKLLAQQATAEEGQALVEYALLLSLIAIVTFGAVNEFGLGVSSLYSKIYNGVPHP
jgi:Flp pilus assembly pilin Flp